MLRILDGSTPQAYFRTDIADLATACAFRPPPAAAVEMGLDGGLADAEALGDLHLVRSSPRRVAEVGRARYGGAA
ncbi:hypothetical protein ACFV8Z_03325 [Streptomyces sp. NPDC059837]|uniref:hypothetical protein n=1 Tax=Streptomyces sp. NPDC059837 TaxID=3346968 RepID=UPI0036460066